MSATQLEANSSAAARHWQKQAVLTDAVLEPLYQLNWDFLTMLTRLPAHWRPAPAGHRLPDPVFADLLTMGHERRRLVARCPFSLFSGRFHDDRHWRDLTAATTPEEGVEPGLGPDSGCGLIEFGQLALFYAWHLARANPAAARVVLGMVDRTLDIFRVVALSRLQEIAVVRTDVFSPRWPERTTFWQALLASAGTGEEKASQETRLLGIQMLAAEVSTLSSVRKAGLPDRRV
jgi:hypothetical protein